MRLLYIVMNSLITITYLSNGNNVSEDPPAVRAANLLKQMKLYEKVNMVHGNGTGQYVGVVPGNKRLNIPQLRMNDGPQGYRDNKHHGTTTQWPSGLTVAASFDRTLMGLWGEAMGQEFRDKGANVQFGPGVNLLRVPTGGRNFEYLSGEDPYLGHELVQPIVKGIQSKGVIANVKHFINNNQENDRHLVSEDVDERTQMELYFPVYEGAVKAGVLSMMCGNNKVNGVYSCENNRTVNTILKSWLGFKGWMLSDYQGTRSTIAAANGGLDMQMPGCIKPNQKDPLQCDSDHKRPNYFGEPLKKAIQNGSVSQSTLDDKVLRILTAMFTIGLFDHPSNGTYDANVTSAEHVTLARNLAEYSAVLLQNKENILPLSTSDVKTFAILGAPAQDAPITGGGGSGAVVPAYISTIFHGVRDLVNSDVTYDNANGKLAERVTYNDGKDLEKAANVAASADVAIIVVATSSKENVDRPNLTMPGENLIKAVAAKQKKTVVVVASPGAFLAQWADKVAAILYIGMSGQEQGNAVANLLFGQANGCPCGKLPFTIPNKENEVGFTPEMYPGVNHKAEYSEHLAVGYRWYTMNSVRPHFAFGFGLSYTSFLLTHLSVLVQKEIYVINITFTIENVGQSIGKEVAQVYLQFPHNPNEAPLQLKGFETVSLSPGNKKILTFMLGSRDISIWDIKTHAWLPQKGKFVVKVGTSSDNTPLNATFEI